MPGPRSAHLTGLTNLVLCGNRIGDAGANALLASPNAPNWRWLRLSENGIRKPVKKQLQDAFGSRVEL